jgi:hypothetical protein
VPAPAAGYPANSLFGTGRTRFAIPAVGLAVAPDRVSVAAGRGRDVSTPSTWLQADVVDRLDSREWTSVTNRVARSSGKGHGHDVPDVVVRATRTGGTGG